MNKPFALLSVSFLLLLRFTGFSQTKFSEGSIVYNIRVNTSDASPKLADGFDGATNTIYVKGSMSRTELVSVYGTQSTIMDKRTGSVTVLKEYGDKKYLISMTQSDWADANRKYDSVVFTYGTEHKTVAGYDCQKAVGKLKNGETFIVYFTKDLVPENEEIQYSNRTLGGIALEYESNLGKNKVTFTATKISFDPVPASKFDLPKTGFRVLTYKESKGDSN